MKKFLGLLLCCTAFAYNGERVNFEVPAGLDYLEESYSFDPGNNGSHFDQIWSGEAGYMQVSSTSYYEGEEPWTVDHFLEWRQGAEILERAENGVTILENQEVTRLIITENGYHLLGYECEQLNLWLPYIQNAEVGIPTTNQDPYKGDRIQIPEEGEAYLYEAGSFPKERFEFWDGKDRCFYILNQLQGEDELDFFSIRDLHTYVRGLVSGLPFGRKEIWDFELLERSESEMLFKLHAEDSDELLFLLRLIVTPESRHVCLLQDLPANEEEALITIKTLKVIACY